MKRLFVFFTLMLPVLASCQGGSASKEPIIDPPVIEEPRPTLTELFDAQIAKQKDGTPRDKIFIVAHRANTRYGQLNNVPDNSIPGIECAIKYGADMVELDVRPTKDGKLILMHNASVDATTNGTGDVSSLTLDQIKRMDMKKGGKIYKDEDGNTIKVPTLEESLLAWKDKIYLNLDVKDANPSKLCGIFGKFCMQGQLMMY
ncbi:MAG: glycerophosphodiester phosphodiesterase family protein, partial [Bacteroidales bacterium]|nr:glycerophosphodiester phosphodiesterase family protein [Bacteroidales bacterium]